MITKERLEELIEQGATIYSTDTKFYLTYMEKYLKLYNKLDHLEFNDKGEVKLFIVDNDWWHWFKLEDLFTKEQAEWIAKMHTQRMEYFEPPMFDYKDGRFVYKAHIGKSLSYWISITVDKIKNYIDITEHLKGKHHHNFGEATKENYEKAVEYARKLFLG